MDRSGGGHPASLEGTGPRLDSAPLSRLDLKFSPRESIRLLRVRTLQSAPIDAMCPWFPVRLLLPLSTGCPNEGAPSSVPAVEEPS